MAKTGQRSAPPAPPKPRTMQIDVAPAPEAGEAMTLREQATALVIEDRPSHTRGLEFVRGAKQLKRKIEEHWSRITRSVDDLKKNLLDLKRQDLEPVEAAIRIADVACVDYQTRQEARERAEQDRIRRENEQRAQTERDRQLAEQEARALKLEESSTTLSARELAFVDLIIQEMGPSEAAKRVGYQDPSRRGIALINNPKIMDAVYAKRQAIELRKQTAATKAAPLDYQVPKVASEVAKVSGTRTVTYYSCAIDHPDKLFAALIAGTVPADTYIPNQSELNRKASDLKDTFEAAYPGCRLVRRTSIAG